MTSGSWRKRRAQRAGERRGVEADLALVDHRAPILVHELDRILDGDDVRRVGAVDVVDHRRQRRRLARAGDAGDEDEPALLLAQLGHHRRQVQLVEPRHLGRDDAQDHAGLPALLEHVDAVAHAVGRAVREVGVVVLLEDLALPVAHQVDGEGADDLRRQRRRVAQRAQVALDAKDRRQPGLEVHVRGAELAGRPKHVVENLVHGHIVPQHATISLAYVCAIRCPHCKAELPEQASFCASCGRRIEGWSRPQGRHPRAPASPALPGSEEATRQMSPTPSLLRAAALSVKKGGKKDRASASDSRARRSAAASLILAMLVVAARRRPRRLLHRPRPRPPPPSPRRRPRPAFRRTTPAPPLPLPLPAPSATPQPAPCSVAAAPTAPGRAVRKSKPGKKAHVHRTRPPVAVKAAQASLRPAASRTNRSPPTPSRSRCPPPSTRRPKPPPRQPRHPRHRRRTTNKQAEATLDADSVRFVVRQHLPQVRACYGRAFKDSSPGGAVEIGFAIDASGRAKNVRTETNTTDSEPLAHCLETRVREWQFPRPVGGDYELIYPFVFAPGS